MRQCLLSVLLCGAFSCLQSAALPPSAAPCECHGSTERSGSFASCFARPPSVRGCTPPRRCPGAPNTTAGWLPFITPPRIHRAPIFGGLGAAWSPLASTADAGIGADLRATPTRRDAAAAKGKDDNSFFDPLHGSLSFPGKHKWLGGAVDDTDGCIYGVPSHATEVICLSPTGPAGTGGADSVGSGTGYEVRTVPLPPSVAVGKFKWLRGIVRGGYLYGIPAWSSAGVLRVDVDRLWGRRRGGGVCDEGGDGGGEGEGDGVVTVLPLPPEAAGPLEAVEEEDNGDSIDGDEGDTPLPTRWLWHGAALNADGTAIYCIPSNARSVLKVNLTTSETSLLPIPLGPEALSKTNKWYGGILGEDGAVYGVPYAASGVLRIDADADKDGGEVVSVLGDFGAGRYSWHGGIKSPSNGAIYTFPAHSPDVLKIDTRPRTRGERLSRIKVRRAPYDGDGVERYKWLGGALGADGAVYGIPSDASSVLRIDTESDTAVTFGVVGGEKNKWQGGVLSWNGFVYAIPSNARNVLQIDTRKEGWDGDAIDGRSKVTMIGDLPPRKDKWQGGFIGIDDRIYGMPENFDKIMIVTPQRPRWDDDDPKTDVSVDYF